MPAFAIAFAASTSLFGKHECVYSIKQVLLIMELLVITPDQGLWISEMWIVKVWQPYLDYILVVSSWMQI